MSNFRSVEENSMNTALGAMRTTMEMEEGPARDMSPNSDEAIGICYGCRENGLREKVA